MARQMAKKMRSMRKRFVTFATSKKRMSSSSPVAIQPVKSAYRFILRIGKQIRLV